MTPQIPQSSPILFVDFDGVLNNHRYPDHVHGIPAFPSILPHCVENLNKILLCPARPQVVLSTAWRYKVFRGEITLRGYEIYLQHFGLTPEARIIDTTTSDEDIETRGKQIRDWLNENGGNRKYLVLDDMDLGISDENLVFLQTDPRVGLTAEDAGRSIAFLTG